MIAEAEAGPLELARLITAAAALVHAEGWVPVALEGTAGTTLSFALCRSAGCEFFRPNYPIVHTYVCTAAHARITGWLYLEGLAATAEVRVDQALGEWERWARPGAAVVGDVAAAVALMLTTAPARASLEL